MEEIILKVAKFAVGALGTTGLVYTSYVAFKELKFSKTGITILVIGLLLHWAVVIHEDRKPEGEDGPTTTTNRTDTTRHVVILDTLTNNTPIPKPEPLPPVTGSDPKPKDEEEPDIIRTGSGQTTNPCESMTVGDVLFVNNSDVKVYVYYNTIEWQIVDYPVIVPAREQRKKQVPITGGTYFFKVTSEPVSNSSQRPPSLKNINGKTGGSFQPVKCAPPQEVDVSI